MSDTMRIYTDNVKSRFLVARSSEGVHEVRRASGHVFDLPIRQRTERLLCHRAPRYL